MTNKVKLTQEQAEAIENLRSNKRHNSWEYIVKRIQCDPFKNEYKEFNNMNLDTLIRAFYVGYEVEPQFKVGDWVVSKYGPMGVIGVIRTITEGVYKGTWYLNGVFHLEMDCGEDVLYRHATPEEIKAEQERQFWTKLGRELKGFRVGDIFMGKDGIPFFIGNSNIVGDGLITPHTAKLWYEKGDMKGFYPVESYVSFGGEDDEHTDR